MKVAARKILSRTLWMARGTATVMGLAVMLAVVLGVGTTALAAVPGDPLRLGQVNPINTITRLAGNTNNPMLRINNASTGTNATALDLQVAQGKPPMKVNSTREVANLNASSIGGKGPAAFLGATETAFDTDRFDGKFSTAFFSGKTYLNTGNSLMLGVGESGFAEARCDDGDAALTGGYNFGFSDSSTVHSVATGTNRYTVGFEGPRTVFPNVTCADFPPLR